MASRRPIVIVNGELGELPVDDNLIIPGASYSATVTVDFGASFTDKASAVVTGKTWVALTTCFSAMVATPVGVDPDELRLLNMQVQISDIIAGTGFTVTVHSEPEAKGTYDVLIVAV